MDKIRFLMIKAALQCQECDFFLKKGENSPFYTLKRKENALKRYYQYGGKKELINLYTQKDLDEAKI